MIYPSGRVIGHSLQKRFSKLLRFLPKNLQHTQWRMNKTRLSAVNFIRKSWSESFNVGIVYNRIGFKCICATISRHYTELFYKLFTRATESGWSMGGCNFRNILPIIVPKCYGGKKYLFWQETFKVVRILLSRTWSLPFHYGFCWSDEHSHSRKRQSQRKLYHS